QVAYDLGRGLRRQMAEVEDHRGAQEELRRVFQFCSQFRRYGLDIETREAQVGDADLAELQLRRGLEIPCTLRHPPSAPARARNARLDVCGVAFALPRQIRQGAAASLQVGVAHEFVTAHRLGQQADRAADTLHDLLADFVE